MCPEFLVLIGWISIENKKSVDYVRWACPTWDRMSLLQSVGHYRIIFIWGSIYVQINRRKYVPVQNDIEVFNAKIPMSQCAISIDFIWTRLSVRWVLRLLAYLCTESFTDRLRYFMKVNYNSLCIGDTIGVVKDLLVLSSIRFFPYVCSICISNFLTHLSWEMTMFF